MSATAATGGGGGVEKTQEEAIQDSTILHVIGDSGDFVDGSRAQAFFSRFPQTTRYHTLAVFGGQGSGKSTLLNRLFHTHFATMREDGGRSQTTKGAFAALIRDGKKEKKGEGEEEKNPLLLVIDFEGTDGMERGEDQSLEKKLSLFAVAAADVVVVNMFANEVGRFNAANLSLLRTVFEMNLRLFHQLGKQHEEHSASSNSSSKNSSPNKKNNNNENSPSSASEKEKSPEREEELASSNRKKEVKPTMTKKTTLFFVIRDFTSGTLDKNAEVMTSSLEKIWNQVAKPDDLRSVTLQNFFDLRFACLPHYVLQRERFDLEVELLKNAFLENVSDIDEEREQQEKLQQQQQQQEGLSEEEASLQSTVSRASSGNLTLTASTGLIMNAGIEYVFKNSPYCSTGIPLHDNEFYFAGVWSTIKSQSDLDIPSQRLLIAQMRSEETSHELLGRYQAEVISILQQLEAGIIRRGISEFLESLQRKYRNQFKECMKLYINEESGEQEGEGEKNQDQNEKKKKQQEKEEGEQEEDLEDVGSSVQHQTHFVHQALEKMSRDMNEMAADIFKGVARSLATALLRSNEAAVQSILDNALKKQLPRYAEKWVNDYESITGTGTTQQQQQQQNSEGGGSQEGGLERTESKLLSNLRQQESTAKTLASDADVSVHVACFWADIIRDIDEVVRHLEQDVNSHRDKKKQEQQQQRQNNNNNNNNQKKKQNYVDPRSEEGVLLTEGSFTATGTETSDTIVKEIARAFSCDAAGDSSIKLVFQFFSCGLEDRVRSRMRQMTSDTVATLTNTFEKFLLHGEHGQVKFFGTKAMLASSFSRAQACGYLLLACLTVMRGRWYPSEITSALQSNYFSSSSSSSSPQRQRMLEETAGMNLQQLEEFERKQNSRTESTRTWFAKIMEKFEIKYVLSAASSSSSSTTSTSSSSVSATAASSAGDSSSSSSSVPSSPVEATGFIKELQYPSSTTSNSNSSVSPLRPASFTSSDEEEAYGRANSAFRDKFVLLDEAEFRRAFDLFSQHCKFTWQFQVRQLEMNAASGGPWWVYGLLAFFVLKEAIYIFRDPVLLVLFGVIIYFFCLNWIEAQYHRFVETGPQQVVVPLRMVVARVSDFVSNITGKQTQQQQQQQQQNKKQD